MVVCVLCAVCCACLTDCLTDLQEDCCCIEALGCVDVCALGPVQLVSPVEHCDGKVFDILLVCGLVGLHLGLVLLTLIKQGLDQPTDGLSRVGELQGLCDDEGQQAYVLSC